MAKQLLTNGLVLVNSVDISNHVSAVSLPQTRPEADVTSMGDTATSILLGIPDITATITVWNDYAVASIDAQMSALSNTNTPFPLEVRINNAARSTSNPSYFFAGVLLPAYNPVSGGVGDAVSTDLVFRNAAQTGMQRLTA